MNRILGLTVQDTITGIKGIAIGYVEYLTGCNQVLVQPKGNKKDIKVLDSYWFDEQRLKEFKIKKIVLNNRNPGFDKEPPKI